MDMVTLIAHFESHADSVAAWVTRSKTDPCVYDVTLRDDRKGLLERVCALPLDAAINQARALVH